MNNVWVKSILPLVVISLCVSLFFIDNLKQAISVFFVASFLQIILYNIYKQILQFFAVKLENERLSEFSKQSVEVVCPCARGVKHLIPIQLDVDNSYVCLDCNKNVTVKLDVNTYLETIPVDTNQKIADIIKKFNNEPRS